MCGTGIRVQIYWYDILGGMETATIVWQLYGHAIREFLDAGREEGETNTGV